MCSLEFDFFNLLQLDSFFGADLSGAVVAVAGEDDGGAAVGVAGDPGAVHREHHQQHQHSHHHDRPGQKEILFDKYR